MKVEEYQENDPATAGAEEIPVTEVEESEYQSLDETHKARTRYYSSDEDEEQNVVKEETLAEQETQSVVNQETPVENEGVLARSANWSSSACSDYSYESTAARSTNWGNRPQETWWNYTYGGGDKRAWQNRGYHHFGPYRWSGYYLY